MVVGDQPGGEANADQQFSPKTHIVNVTQIMHAKWLLLAILPAFITTAFTDQTIFDKQLLQRRPDVYLLNSQLTFSIKTSSHIIPNSTNLLLNGEKIPNSRLWDS